MKRMTGLLVAIAVTGCHQPTAVDDAVSIALPAVAELHVTPHLPSEERVIVQRPVLPFFGGGEESLNEFSIKDTAADALARIGPDAVPAIVTQLQDHDPAIRAQAARALSLMGAKAASAVPALITALDDEEENVRRSAARALGQIGPAAKEAVPALIKLLKDPGGHKTPAAGAGQPRAPRRTSPGL